MMKRGKELTGAKLRARTAKKEKRHERRKKLRATEYKKAQDDVAAAGEALARAQRNRPKDAIEPLPGEVRAQAQYDAAVAVRDSWLGKLKLAKEEIPA